MIQSQNIIALAAPPQTGRSTDQPAADPGQRTLWGQLLARFRDLSGAFDSFANDADPEVRSLGREARARWPQSANDYFALGDLCARLTPLENGISETYAAKALAAYARTATIDPNEATNARGALLAFMTWVTDAALQINEYTAIKAGLLVCERVHAMNLTLATSPDGRRLQRVEQELRERMERIFEVDQTLDQHGALAAMAERESRMLCDQGQMLLRQNQASEALALFERSLQTDATNPAA